MYWLRRVAYDRAPKGYVLYALKLEKSLFAHLNLYHFKICLKFLGTELFQLIYCQQFGMASFWVIMSLS